MVENATSFDEDDDPRHGDRDFHSNGGDDSVVYLNNAGQARLSLPVEQAGITAIRRPPWSSSGGGDDDDDNNNDEDSHQERIRRLFAESIDADAAEIAIMPSTAFAITLAAHNLLLPVQQQHPRRNQTTDNNRGGKILVLQDQMCSAVYPWQEICDHSSSTGDKISLEIVPYPDEESSWTAAVLNCLENMEEDCLVACLPPLHWADGALLDLPVIADVCHGRGIWLVVDATQAVGALPISVKRIRPALLACSVHKWLRAPHGTSLVYIAKELHKSWQPLDQHGRSRAVEQRDKNWDDAKNEMGPTGYPEAFVHDARKFDSGGKANPILLPMLRTSLEEVARCNPIELQERLRELLLPLKKWVDQREDLCLTPGPHAWHLIGIRPVASNDNNSLTPKKMVDICDSMKEDGIYLAVRCGAFRISPYIDNDANDIQRLIESLSRRV